jgi:hypothetical protein
LYFLQILAACLIIADEKSKKLVLKNSRVSRLF